MKLQIENLGKVAITVEEGYWDIKKDYDKLVIVQVDDEYATYISRKPVPAGTVLTDRNYWIPFSSLKEEIIMDFNKALSDYNDEVLKWTTFITENTNAINENLKRIEENAVKIEQAVEDNKRDLTNHKNQATTITNILNHINQLRTDLEVHILQFNDIFSTNINRIDSEITAIKNANTTQTADIAALIQRCITIENSIAVITTQMNDFKNDLQSQINTINNTITNVREDLKVLAEADDEIKSTITTTIDAIQKDISAVDTEVDNVKSSIEIINTNIESIQNDLTSKATAIKALQTLTTEHGTALAQHDSEIETINSKLTVHDTLIKDIQEDLKNVGSKIYNMNPVYFKINQASDVLDPYDIIGDLYNKDAEGNVTYCDRETSLLGWIRDNTHRYIGRTNGNSMNIIELTYRGDLIPNGSYTKGGEYAGYYVQGQKNLNDNVFVKFPTTIYYYITPIVTDYYEVCFSLEQFDLPDGCIWNTISDNTFIGAFEANIKNGYARSIAKVRPTAVNTIAEINTSCQASICTPVTIREYNFLTLLFYGWYGTTDSQNMCGYGRLNNINGTYTFHNTSCSPMTSRTPQVDTTYNNATTPDEDVDETNITTDVYTSPCFWGFEYLWGNISEYIKGVELYTEIELNNAMYEAGMTEIDVCVTRNNNLNENITIPIDEIGNRDCAYYVIKSYADDIIRAIEYKHEGILYPYGISKMAFSPYGDILPVVCESADLDLSFTDSGKILDYDGYNPGKYIVRGGTSTGNDAGINSIQTVTLTGEKYVGFRIMKLCPYTEVLTLAEL